MQNRNLDNLQHKTNKQNLTTAGPSRVQNIPLRKCSKDRECFTKFSITKVSTQNEKLK